MVRARHMIMVVDRLGSLLLLWLLSLQELLPNRSCCRMIQVNANAIEFELIIADIILLGVCTILLLAVARAVTAAAALETTIIHSYTYCHCQAERKNKSHKSGRASAQVACEAIVVDCA